ncbi:MAG: 4-alpha-glucanotransferase, partial [Clostridia bacterium]|nr:4-alpha-glucanotransferase [Clostridia bacterium]
MERSSGVLLAVTSLPSKYGIGTLGKEAFAFADFLKEAGQKYWQVLPLGPTGLGDSPYSSFSTFAGNPYLIDLELLIEDGLLTKKYVESLDWGDDPAHVDYVAMKATRETVLQKAFAKGFERDRAAVDRFVGDNVWLPD